MNLSQPLPDFDALMALHQADPNAYEILRKKLLDECVAGAPLAFQAAARSLLIRIDLVRSQNTDPLEAAMAAARMMIDSVTELQLPMMELLEELASFQTAMLMNRMRIAR